jgi:hypothetical protein
MYHPIVKEQVLPGQLEELQTNPHPTETQFKSQAEIKEIKTRRAAPKNLRRSCKFRKEICKKLWLEF